MIEYNHNLHRWYVVHNGRYLLKDGTWRSYALAEGLYDTREEADAVLKSSVPF